MIWHQFQGEYCSCYECDPGKERSLPQAKTSRPIALGQQRRQRMNEQQTRNIDLELAIDLEQDAAVHRRRARELVIEANMLEALASELVMKALQIRRDEPVAVCGKESDNGK